MQPTSNQVPLSTTDQSPNIDRSKPSEVQPHSIEDQRSSPSSPLGDRVTTYTTGTQSQTVSKVSTIASTLVKLKNWLAGTFIFTAVAKFYNFLSGLVNGIAQAKLNWVSSDLFAIKKSLMGIGLNSKKVVTSSPDHKSLEVASDFEKDLLRNRITVKKNDGERVLLRRDQAIPDNEAHEMKAFLADAVGEEQLYGLSLLLNQASFEPMLPGMTKKLNESIAKKLDVPATDEKGYPVIFATLIGVKNSLEYHVTIDGDKIRIEAFVDYEVSTMMMGDHEYEGKKYNPGDSMGFITFKQEITISKQDLAKASKMVETIKNEVEPKLEEWKQSEGDNVSNFEIIDERNKLSEPLAREMEDQITSLRAFDIISSIKDSADNARKSIGGAPVALPRPAMRAEATSKPVIVRLANNNEGFKKCLAGIEIDDSLEEVSYIPRTPEEVVLMKYRLMHKEPLAMPKQFNTDAIRMNHQLRREGEAFHQLDTKTTIENMEVDKFSITHNIASSYIELLGQEAFQGAALIVNQANLSAISKMVAQIDIGDKKIGDYGNLSSASQLRFETTSKGDSVQFDILLDFNIKAEDDCEYEGKHYELGDIIFKGTLIQQLTISKDDLARNWKGTPLDEIAPSMTCKDTVVISTTSIEDARQTLNAALRTQDEEVMAPQLSPSTVTHPDYLNPGLQDPEIYDPEQMGG
jgi:hypothetical protein